MIGRKEGRKVGRNKRMMGWKEGRKLGREEGRKDDKRRGELKILRKDAR